MYRLYSPVALTNLNACHATNSTSTHTHEGMLNIQFMSIQSLYEITYTMTLNARVNSIYM